MARHRSERSRKKNGFVMGAEFFKVFFPHLGSDQLSIPPEYVKNFKKSLAEKVILKNTSDGDTWHVDVKETPNGVFLQGGLKSFINYHRLKVGEFLVFRYVGSYTFLVKVFGTNGCKKGALEFKVTAAKSEEESDEEMKQKQTSRKRASPQNDDDLSDDGSTEHSNRSGEVNEVQKEVGASEQPDNSEESKYNKGPFFISVPKPRTPRKMAIPPGLIKKYNLHLEETMTLCNAEGRECPVNIFTTNRGVKSFGKGLHECFEMNNIRPGIDSCKFTFHTERSSKSILVEVVHGV